MVSLAREEPQTRLLMCCVVGGVLRVKYEVQLLEVSICKAYHNVLAFSPREVIL